MRARIWRFNQSSDGMSLARVGRPLALRAFFVSAWTSPHATSHSPHATNQSPPDGPMPPVGDAGEGVADPSWRPSTLTDVYTPEAIRRIMAWFEEMRRYEENGRAKRGCGLRRPTDLILDDEFVQPKARGRAWYLLGHIRSGGVAPIVAWAGLK